MTVARFARMLVALVSTLTFTSITSAAPVLLDFEELGGTYFHNSTSKGFRLSPYCGFGVFSYGSTSNRSANPSNSGCDPSGLGLNTGFAGVDPTPGVFDALLHIDLSGQQFSLSSLDTQGWDKATRVISSKGGDVSLDVPVGFEGFDDPFKTFAFSGPEWTNVQWIEFVVGDCPGACRRIDNIVLTVPEAGTLALVGAALAGAILTRRRKSVAPTI